MIRFAHPEYFYLYGCVPILALIFWYMSRRRKGAIKKFSSGEMFGRLAGEASGRKRLLKMLLVLVAVSSLILGLVNPEVGTRIENVKEKGVDIFIALDVSLSMKAQDIKPDRLDRAKYEISNLIGKLGGDRIGLIVFAGESFVQFPLTTDYSAANLFLNAVDVGTVPEPGTAIGSAIGQAVKSFEWNVPTKKVLVIITDGENNQGDAITQAEEAAKKGVLIYTIGMGSPDGAPIPIYDANGKQVDFKRDQSGNIVLTKLDETSLEKIAAIGNGQYFRATNSLDELDAIYKDVNALQKHEYGAKQFTDFEDQFQYFIALAIILLVAEVIMSDKKIAWLEKLNPLRRITIKNGTNT
jgi:Ca-activated chloride channel homolog